MTRDLRREGQEFNRKVGRLMQMTDYHKPNTSEWQPRHKVSILSLQQYTAELRNQAITESKKALKKFDGRIDKQECRVDNNWTSCPSCPTKSRV